MGCGHNQFSGILGGLPAHNISIDINIHTDICMVSVFKKFFKIVYSK